MEPLLLLFQSRKHPLNAKFVSDGGRNGIGVMPHQRLRFGLDHYAGERLSTAVANDDAARIRKFCLCGPNGGGNSWDAFERPLFANL